MSYPKSILSLLFPLFLFSLLNLFYMSGQIDAATIVDNMNTSTQVTEIIHARPVDQNHDSCEDQFIGQLNSLNRLKVSQHCKDYYLEFIKQYDHFKRQELHLGESQEFFKYARTDNAFVINRVYRDGSDYIAEYDMTGSTTTATSDLVSNKIQLTEGYIHRIPAERLQNPATIYMYVHKISVHGLIDFSIGILLHRNNKNTENLYANASSTELPTIYDLDQIGLGYNSNNFFGLRLYQEIPTMMNLDKLRDNVYQRVDKGLMLGDIQLDGLEYILSNSRTVEGGFVHIKGDNNCELFKVAILKKLGTPRKIRKTSKYEEIWAWSDASGAPSQQRAGLKYNSRKKEISYKTYYQNDTFEYLHELIHGL